jgi:hypothetical protein
VVKATGKNIHEEFAARKTCQQYCGGLTVSTVPAREKTITTRIMITHANHAMKSKHGELRSILSVSFTFMYQSVMIPVILKMSPVHRLRLHSTHLLLKNSCSA